MFTRVKDSFQDYDRVFNYLTKDIDATIQKCDILRRCWYFTDQQKNKQIREMFSTNRIPKKFVGKSIKDLSQQTTLARFIKK